MTSKTYQQKLRDIDLHREGWRRGFFTDVATYIDSLEAEIRHLRSPAMEEYRRHYKRLAASQEPLGKDFEEVWDKNAKDLYED